MFCPHNSKLRFFQSQPTIRTKLGIPAVEDKYRREGNTKDWYDIIEAFSGGAFTESTTVNYKDITITGVQGEGGTSQASPRFKTNVFGATTGVLEVIVNAECADADGFALAGLEGTEPHPTRAQTITSRANYVFSGEIRTTSSSYRGTIYQGMSLLSNLGKTLRVYSYTIRYRIIEDEYLPTSLCSNGIWRNTAGGSDLTATNNDKINYNTAPLLQEKLWGDGAPTFAPDAIGQTYIDTTNKVTYTAYGTTNANDWKA